MSSRPLVFGCLLTLSAGSTLAQGPVDPHVKVEFENAQVRVTRATYPAGFTTASHTHDLPRAVVELADSNQRAEDGTVTARKRWTSRFAAPNTMPHKTVFVTAAESITVELKGAPGAGVPVPATVCASVSLLSGVHECTAVAVRAMLTPGKWLCMGILEPTG